MQHILETVTQAFVITGFVFIMMVALEYVSVLTRGRWDRALIRAKRGQLAFSAFLGATPGCLGAYAAGSLYTHRLLTFGALLACMIATCGDEAFIMLALFPGRAVLLIGILFGAGLAGGALADMLLGARRTATGSAAENYTPVHVERPECLPFSRQDLVGQWRNCSPQRGLLTAFLVLFLIAVLTGHIGHQHLGLEALDGDRAGAQSPNVPASVHGAHTAHSETPSADTAHAAHAEGDWLRITLLALALVGLGIVGTVPDHFLDEHLWKHIALVHIWRILLWTTGALVLTHFLIEYLDVEHAIAANRLPLLLVACLVGIIPQSGPHLVFVTLYADGSIPFSILLANSIVQDGHGAIPLLAHSRRAFAGVKAIKFVLGLAVGLAGHVAGF